MQNKVKQTTLSHHLSSSSPHLLLSGNTARWNREKNRLRGKRERENRVPMIGQSSYYATPTGPPPTISHRCQQQYGEEGRKRIWIFLWIVFHKISQCYLQHLNSDKIKYKILWKGNFWTHQKQVLSQHQNLYSRSLIFDCDIALPSTQTTKNRRE